MDPARTQLKCTVTTFDLKWHLVASKFDRFMFQTNIARYTLAKVEKIVKYRVVHSEGAPSAASGSSSGSCCC